MTVSNCMTEYQALINSGICENNFITSSASVTNLLTHFTKSHTSFSKTNPSTSLF